MSLFTLTITSVVVLCILQRGVIGIFWVFPAVLFINFLAFGRLAKFYTVVYFAVVSATLLLTFELEIASRAVTGLLVTILITQIFIGMIDKLQKQLVDQSNIDPLTGALNRREMDTVLETAIERKHRTQTPATLLMFDIDRFKSVNDTYGHAIGDHVLKELAMLIHRRGRGLDQLFRLGGEEFMLYLPDTPSEGAVALAEELRMLVAGAKFIDGRKITISIGVSELGFGENIDDWMRRGDEALFSAKYNGRDRVVSAVAAVPIVHASIPVQSFIERQPSVG